MNEPQPPSDDMEWVPPRDAWLAVPGHPGKELQRVHDGYWQPKDPTKRTGKEEVCAAILATPNG